MINSYTWEAKEMHIRCPFCANLITTAKAIPTISIEVPNPRKPERKPTKWAQFKAYLKRLGR